MSLTRRGFVQTAGAAVALSMQTATARSEESSSQPAERTVRLFGDGIGLSPHEYAALLSELSDGKDNLRDYYLLGGEVERFEQYCATLLGKEMAVFIPSGTLANHLAIRALAGSRRRVIVPEMSHVYNDTGDACQTLSGLNLIPLAPGTATFTREDVENILDRTAGGRVATDVGAILIESPVRRLRGEMFDWDEAKRITDFARDRGIGTHLDGARLFIACAYTGISPAEYAAPFDTVYVSLWKYFNSNVGAILAGPKQVLEGMFHTRRMFGGNLHVGWPSALVARHYMDGFVERLRSAVRISEEFYRAIAQHPNVNVLPIPNGTNLTTLSLTGVDPDSVSRRLAERKILLGRATEAGNITLGVNETWNRTTATKLTNEFENALQ
jgi:threonine aldolase